MEQSILLSTKKVLGISPDDDSFDLDIVTHINTAFSVLHHLGVGPVDGYTIEDEEATWAEFLPAPSTAMLNLIKTIVYLRVRMLFDPPTTSYLIGATEKQMEQYEWRLSTLREEYAWVDPDPPGPPAEEILDGGGAY